MINQNLNKGKISTTFSQSSLCKLNGTMILISAIALSKAMSKPLG